MGNEEDHPAAPVTSGEGPDRVRAVVERIHAAPVRVCLVVAGAGARAVAWLLGVPGASRTVLDAQVPYSMAALDEYAGFRAEQHVSVEEAFALADSAYGRACRLAGEDGGPVAGVACTAAIATDRPKRGTHRAHVAWRGGDGARCLSLTLTKGARDRDGEEEVVSRLVLRAVAEACGLDAEMDLGLLGDECIGVTERSGDDPA